MSFNKPKVFVQREINVQLQAQIASVAIAVEVIERKLIKAGVLKADELMEDIKKMAAQKMQQPTMVSGNGHMAGDDD